MEPAIPIDSPPEEEQKETEKKRLSKGAKIAIIISSIVVVLLGVAAFLLLVVFKKTEPEIVLTDRDILTSISWEKKDAPTVIWTFRPDGSGEITTNKANYYDIKWALNDGEDEAKGEDHEDAEESVVTTLDITTAWLYELKDSFTFKLDRESNSFTVKNLADETESTFVPLGTAEKAASEQTEESKEPDELEKTKE
ncbi:hypothetical protein IKG31_01165 [Candidatus Saccharibacteria bacterium]|nr:hypothetical protein [Candidatus Saccharibacteria bacterium]